MPIFRSRVIIIEAIRWMGGDYKCLETFCGKNWGRADALDEIGPQDAEQVVVFNPLENQWLNVPIGHWIIRGIRGELYPCHPDVFSAKYEEVPL